MDILKKIWAFSFRPKNEVKDLVIPVIIYFVAPTALGVVITFLSFIPGLKIIANLLSAVTGLFGTYCTAGIVFCFLNYFKVGPFKD